jgi:hypothetical protein
MKNNRVVRPKTYDRPHYRSQERKLRALARAADADVSVAQIKEDDDVASRSSQGVEEIRLH